MNEIDEKGLKVDQLTFI